MVGEKIPFGNKLTNKASDKNKNRWPLNALILAGVFLLSALLPAEYKVLAPLLFVIPFIISVADKLRRAGEDTGNPSRNHHYSPPMPDHRIQLPEPYSYRPKNPKDPRKYKPIG